MSDNNKNPFKEMEDSLREVPPHMKKKVMSDIANAKLVMDMATLFTYNYTSAIEGMFKTKS